MDLVADNMRNTNINQGPLFMNSGAVYLGMLWNVCTTSGCIGEVFGGLPTRCIRGVVEAFPLDRVQ